MLSQKTFCLIALMKNITPQVNESKKFDEVFEEFEKGKNTKNTKKNRAFLQIKEGIFTIKGGQIGQ